MVVTHQCFADDLLIVCNANLRSIKNLKDAILRFEKCSGQAVIANKSAFYVSNYVNKERRDHIASYTGFVQGTLPFPFFGCVHF